MTWEHSITISSRRYDQWMTDKKFHKGNIYLVGSDLAQLVCCGPYSQEDEPGSEMPQQHRRKAKSQGYTSSSLTVLHLEMICTGRLTW